MVEFGKQPKSLRYDPSLKPPPKPEPVVEKPILSETPVIDNVQANGDVSEPQTIKEAIQKTVDSEEFKGSGDIDYPATPASEILGVKPEKLKKKSKHGKKKQRGRKRKNTGR